MFTNYNSKTFIFAFLKDPAGAWDVIKKRVRLSARTYQKNGSGAASKLATPGRLRLRNTASKRKLCPKEFSYEQFLNLLNISQGNVPDFRKRLLNPLNKVLICICKDNGPICAEEPYVPS